MRNPSSLFDEGLNWAAGHLRRAGSLGRGGAGVFGFGGTFPSGHSARDPGSRRAASASRGDIRAGILALLGEEPRNGYQIMQELERRSGGLWRPSPGAVYPALQQLQDEGLIQAREAGTGRVFELTEQGRRYLAEHRAETEAPWDWASAEADEDLLELFGEIRHIAGALWQIANSGEPAQLARARQVLSEARRALHAIASEEPSAQG